MWWCVVLPVCVYYDVNNICIVLQPNIEKPGTVSKVFASNLERQLLFTRRPTLLELQSVCVISLPHSTTY